MSDDTAGEQRPVGLGAKPDGPIPTHPYRRFAPYLVGLGVVALVAAWILVSMTESEPDPVRGTAAVDDKPFGAGSVLPPGPTEAVFSPDGRRLVVIDEGRVRLAVDGELIDVTDPGGRVVDVAWTPGSNGLLVVEGPSSTGILPVVGPDGESLGVVKPDPPLQPGAGYGVSVDPGGREAVLVAVERPTLEDEGRYLASVDLATGATKRLTTTAANVRSPRHIAARRVAATVDGDNGPEVIVLDVAAGNAVKVADGELIGVAGGRPVVLSPGGRRVVVVPLDGRDPEVLADIPEGVRPVAVDPAGTRVLVLERAGVGEDLIVRLRALRTRRPDPPAGSRR